MTLWLRGHKSTSYVRVSHNNPHEQHGVETPPSCLPGERTVHFHTEAGCGETLGRHSSWEYAKEPSTGNTYCSSPELMHHWRIWILTIMMRRDFMARRKACLAILQMDHVV